MPLRSRNPLRIFPAIITEWLFLPYMYDSSTVMNSSISPYGEWGFCFSLTLCQPSPALPPPKNSTYRRSFFLHYLTPCFSSTSSLANSFGVHASATYVHSWEETVVHLQHVPNPCPPSSPY